MTRNESGLIERRRESGAARFTYARPSPNPSLRGRGVKATSPRGSPSWFLLALAVALLQCAGFFAFAAEPNLIDAHIDAALKKENLTPARRADDITLHRRLHLDLIGRIPTAKETAAFLADKSPDRIDKLIDALLVHDEMPVHWRGVINGWLNNALGDQPPFGMEEFLAFLQKGLAQNRPWDQLARQMLNPSIDGDDDQGAAYVIAARLTGGGDKQEKLDNLTTAVASGFFGIQLQCAKCHDHPLVRDWTQDHFYGLAAFLNRTETAKLKDRTVLGERADGEVKFITTDKRELTAKLMFLDSKVIAEPALPKEDAARYVSKPKEGPMVPKFSRRSALVEHAINERSPFFRKSVVNRVWKELMGRGLVEPVDQMYATNPASHPALLDALADDLAASKFDLRRLMATILRSAAYQRSSIWPSEDLPEPAKYAVANLKPLNPSQITHSFALAAGYLDQHAAKLEREAKARKPDAKPEGPAVVATTPLGQARVSFEKQNEFKTFARRYAHDGNRFEATAAQALFLTYNEMPAKWLKPGGDNFAQRLVKMKDDAQLARELFLAVLSREPSANEAKLVAASLNDAGLKEAGLTRDAAVTELLWAMLTGSEFRFNH